MPAYNSSHSYCIINKVKEDDDLKDKLLHIYHTYLNNYSELKKESALILCIEGLGAYTGMARKECMSKHPNGRMGAVFAAFVDGELYYTSHASTLPDDPQGSGEKFNDGMPIPTVQKGIYKVYSKLHKGRPALELGLGQEKIPVIRRSGLSTSTGINIHRRTMDDLPLFAWSTGCITVLEDRFTRIIEKIGVTKDGKYLGDKRYIGKVIIDRTLINSDLQLLYHNIYGSCYEHVFKNEVNNIYNQALKQENEILKAENKRIKSICSHIKRDIEEVIE